MRKAMRHNEPNGNAGELMSELVKVVWKGGFFFCLQVFIAVRVQAFKNAQIFTPHGLLWVDYNYINTIKEKTGIDIEDIAKNLKDFNRKPEDEE